MLYKGETDRQSRNLVNAHWTWAKQQHKVTTIAQLAKAKHNNCYNKNENNKTSNKLGKAKDLMPLKNGVRKIENWESIESIQPKDQKI